ncbi:hypothetical protein ACFL2T_05925 [Elusimicrobiota bacterium]
MSYDHTQEGMLGTILIAAGLFTIADAIFFCTWLPAKPPSLNWLIFFLVSGLGVFIMVLGRVFAQLRVHDDGDGLEVRFGPLGNFGTRIPYADITRVEPAESSLIDGWGIHWMPGKGWLYNVSGYHCVRITMGEKIVRVGTDDLPQLIEFLNSKIR